MIKIQCRKNTFFSTPIVEMIKYFLQSVFLQLTVNFILWVFRRGGEQIIHPFARRPDDRKKTHGLPYRYKALLHGLLRERYNQANRPSSLATRATRKRKRKRPAIAPFRLASLLNRKQHALPTPTALTKKRGFGWPNGTSDPQEQGESETAQLARAGRNERAASPPVPALARQRFRFAILF